MTALDRLGTVRIGAGPQVPRVGFGGVRLTGPGTFGPPPDLDEAVRVVQRAWGAGVRLFDTADCYGPEVSEELIARALRPYADDVVIATKGGRIALGDNRWRADGRPEHLRAACEGSIRRLGRDPIDLYQLNAVDPAVPLEESLGALVRLRDAGLIREIGVCNVDVPTLARARDAAPVASVQDLLDVVTRDDDPVVEACASAGLVFLAWFFPPTAERFADPPPALARTAARLGAPVHHVALAWLLARSPVVAPLPGAADLAAYEDLLEAVALDLPASDAALL